MNMLTSLVLRFSCSKRFVEQASPFTCQKAIYCFVLLNEAISANVAITAKHMEFSSL